MTMMSIIIFLMMMMVVIVILICIELLTIVTVTMMVYSIASGHFAIVADSVWYVGHNWYPWEYCRDVVGLVFFYASSAKALKCKNLPAVLWCGLLGICLEMQSEQPKSAYKYVKELTMAGLVTSYLLGALF